MRPANQVKVNADTPCTAMLLVLLNGFCISQAGGRRLVLLLACLCGIRGWEYRGGVDGGDFTFASNTGIGYCRSWQNNIDR